MLFLVKNMEVKDIIGVIFDFNGTMFFDSDKHVEAWRLYIEELTGADVSNNQVQKYIVDKRPGEIIEHFLGYEVGTDMLEQLCEEKESIYRSLCVQDKDSLKLAPGLDKFLDYLDGHNVPMTIATTAHLSNVLFYFEAFDLYRWFDPEKVVCNDKRLRPKPAPDMYLVACKYLNKEPARCLVFEDSSIGIQSAENAGIKNIVAVKGDNKFLSTEGFEYITAVINDYYELNKTIELKWG